MHLSSHLDEHSCLAAWSAALTYRISELRDGVGVEAWGQVAPLPTLPPSLPILSCTKGPPGPTCGHPSPQIPSFTHGPRKDPHLALGRPPREGRS